jgi:hypothetical protein
MCHISPNEDRARLPDLAARLVGTAVGTPRLTRCHIAFEDLGVLRQMYRQLPTTRAFGWVPALVIALLVFNAWIGRVEACATTGTAVPAIHLNVDNPCEPAESPSPALEIND